MAKGPPNPDDSLDGLSQEVDRLLKKLPGADPTLRGSGPGRKPVGLQGPAGTAGGAAPGGGPREPTGPEKMGVWLRVGLAVVAGVLMTQWPYSHPCGFRLYLYMAAVIAVLVAGGWAAVSSWQRRMGAAHVVALLLMLWALVLGAQQVLPRTGYAATAATWRCM